MKKIFRDISIAVVSGLIMLLITVSVNKRKENEDKKPRSLDSLIVVNYQNADMTEMQEKKIQILYDGKPINSYSQVSIKLYNFSDEAFKDVPVYIEIIPTDGDSLKAVEAEITGTNNLPEKILESKEELKHTTKGSLKYKYIIKNANTDNGSFQPVLTADYFIVGSKKPTVKVDIDQFGLSLQGYNPLHYYKPKWYQTDFFFICIIIAIYALIIFIGVKISNYVQEKRNKRLREYLRKSLSEKITSGQQFNDSEAIINEYKKITDKFDYIDASTFKRLIRGMKNPETVDSNSEKK